MGKGGGTRGDKKPTLLLLYWKEMLSVSNLWNVRRTLGLRKGGDLRKRVIAYNTPKWSYL